MKLDILAFGVHPDDIELGCAGTLLAAMAEGKKVGIIDLTQGELGTRGTAETRKVEAENAAKILNVQIRENLKMADGFFKNDEAHQRKVIETIRKFKPEIVLCNAPEDRHPDHGRSSKLVSDASFLSGLIKIVTNDNGKLQEAWRPKYVFHYIQDRFLQPDFVVDISAHQATKMQAIACYTTQFFNTDSDEPQTYISNPVFLETVKARAMMLGKRIGVEYAEGFISEKVIGINSFDAFIQNVT
ncbi:MAG TPA: bacillithiol biosynthesis deacetylase BshB1 [Chitinophagaceae bacterium]|nr:bacillithiol biosynthesis deacetylase BshB1 [Chitinophagaceae bacterium]HMZ45764.1 bacillithiol biosynthesis deacetylase BshB1 [Chitinophagaceae bacterium]HNE93955.1 bacillithiol biosynthesis deacetylase BshB1 [Chitinophagaceae bacterium]HNF29393.1 bacillithiol biosynthesis deacetylase BshB1 [Chitinophagaceae bacterium]HNJ58923.1 bacillithiol biosynthesis deacetylase BshB1 [Chitinophagaceae bacterium]